MMFFAVAFGLLLHALFWGVGLAVLAMPRPWRRFWPVLALPAGFVLQSLVVWIGAYANLPGTNSYAWGSLAVPALLWTIAGRRRGLRQLVTDLSRFGVLATLVAGGLVLLVLPMAIASRGLTTTSLGSCDAADYAAGARVLMEFAHSDRSGFLGLTEVVRVMSVDNFYDFWLRLNHFTPSALIALNGSVLDCAPFQLTGVLTAVLLMATLSLVFWISRAVLGYTSVVSLAVAGIYGLSPLTWYAVAHVAMGQLLAAQAIALLTWAGIALWRGRLTGKRARQFAPVLALGYALVLGSYNFVLIVGLVPVVAFAGVRVMMEGGWGRFARWLIAMLAPLAIAGAIFFERVAGLVERFTLFQRYDFGWRIPILTPEGWLGLVSGPGLLPWSFLGLRWILAAGVSGMLAWALLRRPRGTPLVASLVLPVLAGYAFLEARGVRLGTNASYDAYKLFAVFFPVLLPAFCWWVTLRRGSNRLGEWAVVYAMLAFVITGNLVADGMFLWRTAQPPLLVSNELKHLQKIEAMPDVASVNLRIPDMWSRLWANAFLLRKPQYFPTHTYEGRLNTPLRGDWDLESGVVAVKPPGDARRQVTAHFALVDTRSPQFFRAVTGAGWHQEEFDPKTGEHWQWTAGDAAIQVENPHPYALTVECALDGRAMAAGQSLTLLGPAGARTGLVPLDRQRARVRLGTLRVPPGDSVLTLHATLPPAAAGADDPRALGICAFGLEFSVQAN
jgi:hypothetical protein